MAAICLASNNGATVAPQKYQFHILGSKCLDRFVSRRSFSSSVYNCASFSSLKSQIPCNFRDRVFFVSKLKSFIDGQRRNTYTNLEREGFNDMRRRFKLRLRPTLRLFSRKLKRVSAQSIVNDIGVFLRKNLKRVILVTSISVALGLCYLVLKIMAIPSPKIVPYSDLVMNLQNGTVTRVLFEEGSRRIYFNTKTQNTKSVDAAKESLENGQLGITVDIGVSEGAFEAPQVEGVSVLRASMRKQASRLEWQYSTRKVDHDENFLLGLMRENGTEYSSAPQSVLMSVRSLLITILTLWVPLAPLMWVIYRQLYAANSSARKRRPSNKMVSFDDVEGVGSAKMELMEIVLCLQGAIKYKKLGARLPRGVLLVGPPGTGKTLLARAVAGEAGVPFFSVSASEFVELFVGRGAARIRDLFNMARKSAPSIIFIDELDAVGGKRGRSFNDERDQTLNQLLTEMDGFASDAKVVVIAATNRPEALDSALTRPGRFSRKVLVSEPDEDGRRKILGVHLRDIPMEEDKVLICSLVASLTSGFVGADLANIVNEAALLASRRGGEAVAREDIMEAIERAKYGIINNKQVHSSTLGKELGKLLDWMPSFMGRTGGLRRPLGYHTLS